MRGEAMPAAPIFSNAHTHTVFCDGHNTVEENVLRALELGFVSLGFSIHSGNPYEGFKIENEEKYKVEVARIREIYGHRIEILCGIERDGFYQREFKDFEFMIDSTHMFMKDGEYCHVDHSEAWQAADVEKLYGGDYYAYCADYYAQMNRLLSGPHGDIVGHIDLCTKYNEGNRLFDESSPRYLKYALETAELAVGTGMPIEMNTGAISRGYRTTPYPSMDILRFIREKGGEIMINTDSHRAEWLDTGIAQCVEMARQAGFDHVLRLRKSGFEEVGI